MRRAYFGVEGLDRNLEKGLMYGSQIMVEGESGIGKTVLAGNLSKKGCAAVTPVFMWPATNLLQRCGSISKL